MRHRITKFKFAGGQDATQMAVRKLLSNFFRDGALTTTVPRAKLLKSELDKVCSKVKKDTNATRTEVIKLLGNQRLHRTLFSELKPLLPDVTSGFVTMSRMGVTRRDTAEAAKVTFAHGIVFPIKKEPELNVKTTKSEVKKSTDKKAVTKKPKKLEKSSDAEVLVSKK